MPAAANGLEREVYGVLTYDRVLGLLTGVAVGDALGKPVEMFSAAEIASRFGRVSTYLDPSTHRWFRGHAAGTPTDDTNLTFAVAHAICVEGGVQVGSLMRQHVKAYNRCKNGWGPSTTAVVKAFVQGISPDQFFAANPDWSKRRGKGNGVAMKTGPLAVMHSAKTIADPDVIRSVRVLSDSTHRTELAFASGLVQLSAIMYCLNRTPETFDAREFATALNLAASIAKLEGETASPEAQFVGRISSLCQLDFDGDLARFGNGASLIHESLPLCYAVFLRGESSLDSIFDVIGVGGDTDTNASIVGALVGALRGVNVFPAPLREGLAVRRELPKVTAMLCARFSIPLD